MKLSTFLLFTAATSFILGMIMLLSPDLAANFLSLNASSDGLSALREMGGLIMGIGAINYFLRREDNPEILYGLLLINIMYHLVGLSAEILTNFGKDVSIRKMILLTIIHLFISIGSFTYLTSLKLRDSINSTQC